MARNCQRQPPLKYHNAGNRWQHKDTILLTMSVQRLQQGHSKGTSSNSQHSGHCKPTRKIAEAGQENPSLS